MIGRRELLAGAGMATLFATAGRADIHPTPTVRTRNGLIRGREIDGVLTFTGIPYGAPPIGPLRFKPPRPAAPWLGQFDATRPAATPPQLEDPALPPSAPMSEDCLQLNVWAPKAAGPSPVFVWIYGGGNSSGGSNQPAYQGETFARDGVVCVSLNYRLGVCGFLELGAITGPEDAGSGNNALRDQILALQWVRDNISAFGGDPGNVTLGGQSAGAFNCAALLALPAAKGLFHRVILASGGGNAAYRPDRAAEFARLFVAQLGGPDKLRTAPIAAILKAQQAAQTRFPDVVPFWPVIDGTFLTASPVELLRAGAAANIPTMIGHTRDEYRYFLSPAQAKETAPPKMLHLDAAALPPIVAAYRTAFPTLTPGDRMLRLLGAELIVLPALRVAEAQAAAGAPVYYYELQYSIPTGPFGRYSPHGIDVPLIFEHLDTDFAKRVFGYTAADLPMAKHVHTAWVSFIKSGTIDAGLPGWPRYDLKKRQSMTIDRHPVVTDDIDRADRQIWENIT
jgi:para-nitrobenzyl esterase